VGGGGHDVDPLGAPAPVAVSHAAPALPIAKQIGASDGKQQAAE